MPGSLTQLPAAFLGLPSLHSIIQAIAGGFFGALADALVPSWLKHATIATIQQLVALPDPASWTHVGALQSEMTYLAAMLAPVTLTVAAMRYWAMGLTGSAHPVSAVTRCAGATGALVGYRWAVEQVVAGTNTLTHGVLALPSVGAGLQRIVGVLFGGALLSGAGGVFGAFLVIVGVVFAAGLFAAQVLLTVVLALLIVIGPPLISLAAIPELSHLARMWRDALLAVALVPLGWTALFATAGALCLDATSFTGGAGGLPAHVAAAFAGLITFYLAVRLPFVLLGGLRGRLGHGGASGKPSAGAVNVPSGERVKSARARLRSVGLEAIPAMGSSVGRAAGALGAPAGGPIGAARRSLRALRGDQGAGAHGAPPAGRDHARTKRGARERLREASEILTAAPGQALRATRAHTERAPYPSGGRSSASAKDTPASRRQAGGAAAPRRPGSGHPDTAGAARSTSPPSRASAPSTSVSHTPAHGQPNLRAPVAPAPPAGPGAPPSPPEMHVVANAERQARPAPAAPERQRPTPPRERNGSPTSPPPAKAPPAKQAQNRAGERERAGRPAGKERPTPPLRSQAPRRARKPRA
jgi:hypothetical protein